MFNLFNYTQDEINEAIFSIPTEDQISLLIDQYLEVDIFAGTNSSSVDVGGANCSCTHTFATPLDLCCE